MASLSQQRCFNHAGREAAVRCPGCRRFFCRECVSEHDHRFLCASCIASFAAASAPAGSSRFAFLPGTFRFVGALLLVTVLFFFFGRLLLALPSEFHETTLDEWLLIEGETEDAGETEPEAEALS